MISRDKPCIYSLVCHVALEGYHSIVVSLHMQAMILKPGSRSELFCPKKQTVETVLLACGADIPLTRQQMDPLCNELWAAARTTVPPRPWRLLSTCFYDPSTFSWRRLAHERHTGKFAVGIWDVSTLPGQVARNVSWTVRSTWGRKCSCCMTSLSWVCRDTFS
jgi:hypothetical protein